MDAMKKQSVENANIERASLAKTLGRGDVWALAFGFHCRLGMGHAGRFLGYIGWNRRRDYRIYRRNCILQYHRYGLCGTDTCDSIGRRFSGLCLQSRRLYLWLDLRLGYVLCLCRCRFLGRTCFRQRHRLSGRTSPDRASLDDRGVMTCTRLGFLSASQEPFYHCLPLVWHEHRCQV